MTEELEAVLILLCLLQVKHMFGDYFLQTPKMLSGRGRYLHMGRAQHASVHAAGSVVAFVIVGTPLWLLFVLIVIEWLAHFHIDWGKARYSEMKCYSPTEAGFWRAAGFDQALHQLTYIAMAWAWITWT